jgi:hypothetical protein
LQGLYCEAAQQHAAAKQRQLLPYALLLHAVTLLASMSGALTRLKQRCLHCMLLPKRCCERSQLVCCGVAAAVHVLG